MTELPTHGPAAHLPAPGAGVTLQRLVQLHLDRLTVGTRRAYRQDLLDFATHLGVVYLDEAAALLLGQGRGAANALVLQYRTELIDRGLAPATVNRRLSALRSLVDLGRVLGVVEWSLDVPNLKSETLRDTRGPGRQGYEAMLARLERRTDSKSLRNLAIVRLLFDLALRRSEVVSLDLEHVDLERSELHVLGKGRRQRQPLSVPAPTKVALNAWIEARGSEPGPLFLNFDSSGKGASRRLTGGGLAAMISKLGRAGTGRHVRPHGLRHAAITEALDLTKGDVRAVQRFSRHRRLDTLLAYDDNRQDLGGQVAALVAQPPPDGRSPED